MDKYFYEELVDKSLNAGKLTLELATSLRFNVDEDAKIGTEIITFKPVEISQN